MYHLAKAVKKRHPDYPVYELLIQLLCLEIKTSVPLPCDVLRQSSVWGRRVDDRCDQHPSVGQSTV